MSERLAIGAVAVLAAAGALRTRGNPNQLSPRDGGEEAWHVLLSNQRKAPTRILFKPGIPRFPMPGQNTVTPRTSWSTWGPGYAFAAMVGWQQYDRFELSRKEWSHEGEPKSGEVALWIYRAVLLNPITPTPQDVPDVESTGEVWTIKPVQGELIAALSPAQTGYVILEALEYWNEVNTEGAEGYDVDDPASYHYQSAIPGIAQIVDEALSEIEEQHER